MQTYGTMSVARSTRGEVQAIHRFRGILVFPTASMLELMPSVGGYDQTMLDIHRKFECLPAYRAGHESNLFRRCEFE